MRDFSALGSAFAVFRSGGLGLGLWGGFLMVSGGFWVLIVASGDIWVPIVVCLVKAVFEDFSFSLDFTRT